MYSSRTILDENAMNIRDMWAFDHIPLNINTTGGNVAGYSDYNLLYSANTTFGSTPGGTVSDADGVWLALQSAQSGNLSYWLGNWSVPFTNLIDITQPRSFLGFRFKWNGFGSSPLLGIASSANAYLASLVGPSDFTAVVGKNYYVEVMWDHVANTRTVWVDGAMVVNAQALAASAASLLVATNRFSFCQNTTWGNTGQTTTYQFKDIYYGDDPTGANPRLGPIIATPAKIATAVGAGYIPSTGTDLPTILNTAPVGGATTPNLTAATDGTPLVSTFSTTANPAGVVKALKLLSSVARQSGTSTQFLETLTDQATPTPNSKTLTPIVLSSDAMVYGKSIGLITTALDGSPLTLANIAQLKLSTVASL